MSQASDHSQPGAQPPPQGKGASRDAAGPGPVPGIAGFRLGLLLLWLVSLTLLLTGLNGPPLLDWDEGIVARVALETSNTPWPQRLWPHYWGEPYLNKPPGLHLLVAAAIHAWRALTGAAAPALPPEWLLRLVPALLSSPLVPLLALLQWRLRPGDRLTALLTGAISLTLLPLARHGHLLMLDGVQLVAMVLLWWAVLGVGGASGLANRWREGVFHGLVAGLATSALLLLKAPVALPVLAATLLLRRLDREGALSGRDWAWLALGVAIGLLPGLAWHGGHLLLRDAAALEMWLGQGFARVGSAIEGNSGGPLTPLLEVLEGGWPWLPLWPFGLALAWRQRRRRAGLWSLGLTLLSSALVLPLRTQLPWYSLLLWPPFALVCAPVLSWLVRRDRRQRPPGAGLLSRLPRLWALLGGLLLLAGLLLLSGRIALTTAAQAGAASSPQGWLAAIALVLGGGLLAGGQLLAAAGSTRRLQGLGLLLLADALALALLFASPLWLWELNETWPVADGLALLQDHRAGRDGGEVRLWRQGERPALSWAWGRQIRPEDHINLPAGASIWLLGLEPAEAPGGRCQLLGMRGALRLEHCQAQAALRPGRRPPP